MKEGGIKVKTEWEPYKGETFVSFNEKTLVSNLNDKKIKKSLDTLETFHGGILEHLYKDIISDYESESQGDIALLTSSNKLLKILEIIKDTEPYVDGETFKLFSAYITHKENESDEPL